MEKKTRKSQIVLAVIDQSRHSFTFLLLRTNKNRGEFWQNVTGKIEDEETYEEGGLREAIEETQLNIESIVDIVDLAISHDFIDKRKRNVHEKGFLIILDQKWDVKIDPKEHNDFKWVAMEDVTHNSVKHRGNFEALEKAQYLLRHWGL